MGPIPVPRTVYYGPSLAYLISNYFLYLFYLKKKSYLLFQS